jgi:hypothetical protein
MRSHEINTLLPVSRDELKQVTRSVNRGFTF